MLRFGGQRVNDVDIIYTGAVVLSRICEIATAFFLLTGLYACRPSRDSVAGESPAGPALARYCGQTLGSAEAGIVIDAILPVKNGCQNDLGIYVVALAKRFPETFRVRIFDMRSQEGHAVMRLNHIKCAAVIVNGTTRFDLGGSLGKVLLEGPMDPADLYHVLVDLAAKKAPGITLPAPVITHAPDPDQRRKAGF